MLDLVYATAIIVATLFLSMCEGTSPWLVLIDLNFFPCATPSRISAWVVPFHFSCSPFFARQIHVSFRANPLASSFQASPFSMHARMLSKHSHNVDDFGLRADLCC